MPGTFHFQVPGTLLYRADDAQEALCSLLMRKARESDLHRWRFAPWPGEIDLAACPVDSRFQRGGEGLLSGKVQRF